MLADNFTVSEVLPIEPTAIAPGSYVGTAAMPGPDGKLRALEVQVFPEAARGTGEGHGPWDLGARAHDDQRDRRPGSSPGSKRRRMTLRYKDGEKTIVVPDGVPMVTFKPGDRSLLVPGAKVIVFAQIRNDQPTALRALAGRNGFTPPM